MTDHELGEHEAKIDFLVREMYLMRTDMNDVKAFMTRVKGIGTTFTMAGTFVGAFLTMLVNHFWRKT